MAEDREPVGGQALIEGVMMRRVDVWAAAVRLRDGSIEVDHNAIPPGRLDRWRKIPFVRGTFVLAQSVRIGFRAMTWAANKNESSGKGFSTIGIVLSTIVALTGLILVFQLFPAALAKWLGIEGAAAFNLFEGLVRLVLFVAYIGFIARAADIRRVFQYHGAEHKAVNAYEAGVPLVPAEVQRFSRRHTRCGTTFILWVLVLAIVVNSTFGHPSWAVLVASRILTIPIVAGLAYELIRWSARVWHKRWVRTVMTPGLWLQDLTTREPDDDQVEVAIAALRAVLPTGDPLREGGHVPA